MLQQALGLRTVRVGCWNITPLEQLWLRFLKHGQSCDTMGAMINFKAVLGEQGVVSTHVGAEVYYGLDLVGKVSEVTENLGLIVSTLSVDADQIPDQAYVDFVFTEGTVLIDAGAYGGQGHDTRLYTFEEAELLANRAVVDIHNALDVLFAFVESVVTTSERYAAAEISAEEALALVDMGLSMVGAGVEGRKGGL